MSHRILVVDDEPGVLRVLQRGFENLSWKVTPCGKGAEAIDRFSQERYDLVLLDIFMDPDCGLDVLQALKKRRQRALVMMMTGMGTIDLAVEAMKKGADEFVTKPFYIRELTTKITTLIESRRPRPHPLARRLDEFLRDNSDQPDMSLQILTGEFRVSASYVCRLFRDELKTTFRQRLRRHRLMRAKDLLRSTRLPVREIARKCGFTHQKRLSEAFMRDEQTTPRRFRQLG